MIDEKLTLEMFGYTSDTLSRGSGKRVVAVCDECGAQRFVMKRAYRELCSRCVRKGSRHCNFGKHLSEETKQKISAAEMGAKNHNWKGGVGGWRYTLLSTRAYKNWRTAVFERDDYTCQMCDRRGGDLEAHHIEPVRQHQNDLSMWDIDNGVTLCKKCHDKTKFHEDEFASYFQNDSG